MQLLILGQVRYFDRCGLLIFKFMSLKPVLTLGVIGHVESGKSSLCGRILLDLTPEISIGAEAIKL